jgi:mono/diheme cytochrome c family protein
MTLSSNLSRCLLALAAGLTLASAAQADSDHALLRNVPAAYTQECASCHTGYPPGMLPARSWQRIMSGLDQHYGTDASLDAATVRQLSGWLQANAGTTKRVAEEPPEDRITRSAWFVRKHDEIAPPVWKLPSVKSAANCAACHTGTDQGRYSDDNLKFPAGLDPLHRRAWND